MEKQKYIEMNNFIPVNEPLISDESKKYVNIALDTGWISSAGVFVDKFEKDFAKFLGIKYAIAVSSGTAALHVALLAAGLGNNDEVIVPAFTMAATWLAVLYVGAKPIFIDCESDTFNINPTLIEEKITKRTKAIIPVHVYGHSADMDPILKLARKHKLIVIEDAAEAHGATYKGKLCGSMGSISCFSFYGNKIITTGEGGMVVTNNQNLAKRARRFKDLCHSERKRFIHDDIGYNYRITNLQAALGCGELRKINMYIERKINMAKAYKIGLSDIPGITTPIIKNYAKCVYWMYAILIDKDEFGINKGLLRVKLLEKGVDTRDFFYSPWQQPVLKKYLGANESFPVTEDICKKGLYLPSGLALTNQQIEKVIKSIREIYMENHNN